MNEEQFKKLYVDTHTELQLTEALEKGQKGLITTSPGDKNITQHGKIPGKNIIEWDAIKERSDKLNHMLLDAISVKAGDVLDVPVERLIALAIKMAPQKLEGKLDHDFTFADIVKRASIQVEQFDTVDTVETDSKPPEKKDA